MYLIKTFKTYFRIKKELCFFLSKILLILRIKFCSNTKLNIFIMKKLIVIFLFTATFLLFLPLAIYAQGPGGGGVNGNPPCGGPFGSPACPIDGGISFLIAAGLAFGGKKANDLRKKNQH